MFTPDRFCNNIFVGRAEVPAQAGNATNQRFAGFGLWVYDTREFPLQTGGNVYYSAARPYSKEAAPLALSGVDPRIRLVEDGDGVYLHLALGQGIQKTDTAAVSTDVLGKAKIPRLGYENPDGSPLIVNIDFAGTKRDTKRPSAGPFEKPGAGDLSLKVWG